MDLTTVARNAKNHKYKNKAEFAADLDLIWENCLNYNTQEVRLLTFSPVDQDVRIKG
jgi:transcriptional activator SPT7